MISYWGVDHGDEISKADNKYGKNKAPSGGRRVTTALFPGWHGAVAGKKGKKLRSAGTELAGYYGGALGGGVAGGAAGAVLSRGNAAGAQIGSSVGQLAGGLTGTQLGLNRIQRKGYLKRES